MLKKIFCIMILFISNITFANTISIKAIVNDNIITNYDINERMKLSKALLEHSKIKMTDEKIKENVINEMIEDLVKIDEAKKYNISISSTELKEAKKNMEKTLQLGEDGYAKLLKEIGVDESVLNKQIEGDLIWMKFTMQVLRAYVKVQDEEVNQFINNMKNNSMEYTIIPYIIKNNQLSQAENDTKNISTCEEFEKIAKSNGAEGSGIKMTILDSEMQKDLYDLLHISKINTPLKAIRLNGSYTIFYICDKKPYTPKISDDEKEEIKYMILMNKLEAYANKYFEKIKSNALIEIKD